MFNKKYKKGMADAAKAYEAFGKKQEDALKHILEEVRQGKRDLESVLRELNGNIDGLYDYIDSKEKAHLYSVYTPFDIINLNKNDRLFLVGVLCRLTVDKAPNENQQNYIRAVQKYLDVKEPPFGIDPMYIETIEDIPTQKAILQTVLEYLRLQDGDSYDETELQQKFLDAFSVNAKGRKEIMEHIELLYTATGAKGLAEKYGYVPNEAEENVEPVTNFEDSSSSADKDVYGSWNYVNLTEDQVADVYDSAPFVIHNKNLWHTVICSTEKYTIYSEVHNQKVEHRHVMCFNRVTQEVKDITHIFSNFHYAEPNKIHIRLGGCYSFHQSEMLESVYIFRDYLIFDDQSNNILQYNIDTDQVDHICNGELPKLKCSSSSDRGIRGGFLDSYFLPVIQEGKLYAVNLKSKEKSPIRYQNITITDAFSATSYGKYVVFIARNPEDSRHYIFCYDTNQKTTIILSDPTRTDSDSRLESLGITIFSGFSDKWRSGGIYSVSEGTICYTIEALNNSIVELGVVTFSSPDAPPTYKLRQLVDSEFKVEKSSYLIDKDFMGFISNREDGYTIYRYNASDDKFIRIARGGGAGSDDEFLYRIGNYFYMKVVNTGYNSGIYRIDIRQVDQPKIYM